MTTTCKSKTMLPSDACNGMAGPAGFGMFPSETESQNAEYQCDRTENKADAGNEREHPAVISGQGPAVLVRNQDGNAVVLLAYPATPARPVLFVIFFRPRSTGAIVFDGAGATRPLRTIFLEGFVIRSAHVRAPRNKGGCWHNQTDCTRACQQKRLTISILPSN
jgi:hypothetical protein